MTRGALELELADFVTGTEWAAVPLVVRDRVIDLMLDAVACAITGRDAPSRDGFARAVRSLTGAGTAVVVADEPAAPYAAALLNAWQTTATTMCDVYRPRMCHVTPITLGALLAGATSSTSADELRAAFAVGLESTVRLCAAMDRDLYQGSRWHAPGVIGPYGSAATVARLRGLDAATLTRAWGGAGLHSSGTFAAIGSPGVKLTQARAAAAGFLAVELASAGHDGRADAWTHPDGGLFDAYGGSDPEAVTRELGSSWALLDVSLRRWPAASSLQTVIECALAASDGRTDAELEVGLPPQSFKLCAAMGWDDQLSALQSARWVTAVTWLDRECWLDQFAAERRVDEAVAAVAHRVRVIEDDSLPQGAAWLRVDGVLAEQRDSVAGSPERPLARADVLDKLRRAAGEPRAERIAAAIIEGRATPDLLEALAG